MVSGGGDKMTGDRNGGLVVVMESGGDVMSDDDSEVMLESAFKCPAEGDSAIYRRSRVGLSGGHV